MGEISTGIMLLTLLLFGRKLTTVVADRAFYIENLLIGFIMVVAIYEQKGAVLHAFSNGVEGDIAALLEHAGLDDRISSIISADEVQTFKPDPCFYAHFLEKTGAAATTTWLVSSISAYPRVLPCPVWTTFSRSAGGNRAILSQIWSGFVNLTVPLFGILKPVNWQNPGLKYSNGSNKDTLQPQIALGIRRNAGGYAGTGLVFL